MTAAKIIADIGGTNARFALANDKGTGFEKCITFACEDYETIELAIDEYIRQTDIEHVDAICIAAAGPIQNQTVKFTNNTWFIDSSELAKYLGAKSAWLLNDYEAISYSLPALDDSDLINIGNIQPAAATSNAHCYGVIGPGTGLGVGALCVQNDRPQPLITEGGHVGFAPESDEQIEVLALLRRNFERVSIERLLSGPGIENIYQALAQLQRFHPHARKAADIGTLAISGECNLCVQTMDLFFEVLGQAAGDLALTLGANQGIYIAGGICQRYPEIMRNSRFRAGFEAKGGHRRVVELIPTYLIMNNNPGLLGAAHYVQYRM